MVGDARICPQVAYVMAWQDYERVERLTAVNKYASYKIVICDFKRRWRRYLPSRGGGRYFYLDDICRELDQDYSFTERLSLVMIRPKTRGKRLVKRLVSRPFMQVMLNWLRSLVTFRSQFWLKMISPKVMKPSELFLRVLWAKPTNLVCNRLESVCLVEEGGVLWGCCVGMVKIPFGQIADGENDGYNSRWARIIKLSSLNHSYCFCDRKRCLYAQYQATPDPGLKALPTKHMPVMVGVSLDPTCNLHCQSCRKKPLVADSSEQAQMADVVTKLLNAEYFRQAPCVSLAGMGEVFYSPAYQKLLQSDCKFNELLIFSNGTLFDDNQWAKLQGKYQKIGVLISVDAATATTYRKIRGGDFNGLLQNLTKLGLRYAQGEMGYFDLNFVVQRDNFHEMVDFIHLAQRLHAHKVNFTRLNNWGTYTKREYRHKSLIIKGKYLNRELYTLLQNPLFNDPMVNLTAFQPYLANSAKRYGE